MELTQTEKSVVTAWVAGLLEGEGSFLTKSGKHAPIISCQMTDEDVLVRLQRLCGGTLRSAGKREAHWKEIWQWCLQGEPAAELMRAIRPHLGKRRQEAVDRALEKWYARQAVVQKQLKNAENAAKEYSEGKQSLRSIAKKYGVSHETVRRHAGVV